MHNLSKKIGLVAVSLAILASVAPSAKAATIEELMAQIQMLQVQLQALQGTTTPTTTTYNFTRDLTIGSQGDDVKMLQQLLNAKGFTVAMSGNGSMGMETTYFGNATKAALVKFQMAKGITPTSGYFGPKTRAVVNAMSTGTTTPGTTTGGVTPVITMAPMSITLTSDNPTSANVQKGSANNQVMKVTITGATDKATSITGLTLKSYGTTEATGSVDVSAVKLFDENGIQIGNDRTPAGNQVNFVVVPALTIPANGSRTITVTTNIGSSANTVAVVRYGIESATAILGGTTFTGNYPILGNSFTIVPAGQLGALTIGQFGSLPKTSVKSGEKDIVLERFNVAAGSNEDIAVNQVIVTRVNGSDTSFSNIRLRQVGTTNVIAGPVSFSNKKATFNLASPISLVKGASTNLEIIGDVSETSTTSVNFSVNIAAGGVVGRGSTSGTNVTSTGTTTANDISIGLENVSVAMSNSHPQGSDSYIISTTNRKDLAKFDVKATGGDVILNTITLTFDGAANLDSTHYLSSVGIYDGDSLISDLKTINTETSNSFSMNYTLPAGTTKILTVKGITNTLAVSGSATVATTWTSATGYGMASGELATISSSISATAVTVYPTGVVTPSADSTKTPYSQALLAPSNNVTMAAMKIYAQREDMKLTKLVLQANGTLPAQVTSIRLYADDGVTALTDVIANSSNTFTVTSDTILSDVVFTKGVYKTILVKANVNSTGTSSGLYLNIVNGSTNTIFTGQDSGAEYNPAALDLKFTSPYAGGTFSTRNKIVTIAKNSASPSGTISRGSQTVTGIWDVNNYDSTQANATINSIKFISKTGIGSAGSGDTALFKLYDGDGNVLAAAATTVATADNSVTFNALTFTISPAELKQLKLIVDTTSTAKFPSNSQLQFSVEAFGDVLVGAVGTGTIVSDTGSTAITGTGTNFDPEIRVGDRLYLSSNNSLVGTVATITNDTAIVLTANAAQTIGSTAAFKFTAGEIGYGAGMFTVPAVVNVVQLP